jgi:hypothetical protein
VQSISSTKPKSGSHLPRSHNPEVDENYHINHHAFQAVGAAACLDADATAAATQLAEARWNNNGRG